MNDHELETRTRIRIRPYRRSYQMWLGYYHDKPGRALHIGYLPTLGIKIWEEDYSVCPGCGAELTKSAYNTGDGWALFWECADNYDCRFNGTEELEINWSFDDAWMNTKDLEKQGFTIV